MTQRQPAETKPPNGNGQPQPIVRQTTVEPAATPRPPVVERPALAERRVAEPFGIARFRDRLRWGPIIAGLVTALTFLLIFTVLGLAIGFSVFSPTSSGTSVSLAAAIWGICSVFLSFFIGGWLSGETANLHADERHTLDAVINGFMVGASGLVLLIWVTAAGISNVLGVVGNNLGNIARAIAENPSTANNAFNNAANAINRAASNTSAASAFATARDNSWYTFAAIILLLVFATLGGWVGHLSRPDRGWAVVPEPEP